jgi:hypothetical protein
MELYYYTEKKIFVEKLKYLVRHVQTLDRFNYYLAVKMHFLNKN